MFIPMAWVPMLAFQSSHFVLIMCYHVNAICVNCAGGLTLHRILSELVFPKYVG